jgi:cobalamin biosynthesis protein CobD/CbiB
MGVPADLPSALLLFPARIRLDPLVTKLSLRVSSLHCWLRDQNRDPFPNAAGPCSALASAGWERLAG